MASTEDDERETRVESGQEERRTQVKRPMNAFMLWSKEKRRKISSVDPSLHNSHISKILGEEWKTLPSHEKDPFIKESKTLMEKHKVEHPDYHYKPRQNKLTKALKELSSLQTTKGFTPSVKSLQVPTYVPRSSRYTPYLGLERRRFAHEREDYEDLPYHTVPAYYPARSLFNSCTCKLGCVDRECYLAADLYRWRALPSHMRYQERPTLVERSRNLYHIPPIRYGWSVPVLVNAGCESKESRSQSRECIESAWHNARNGVGGGEQSDLQTLERSEKPDDLLCLHKV